MHPDPRRAARGQLPAERQHRAPHRLAQRPPHRVGPLDGHEPGPLLCGLGATWHASHAGGSRSSGHLSSGTPTGGSIAPVGSPSQAMPSPTAPGRCPRTLPRWQPTRYPRGRGGGGDGNQPRRTERPLRDWLHLSRLPRGRDGPGVCRTQGGDRLLPAPGGADLRVTATSREVALRADSGVVLRNDFTVAGAARFGQEGHRDPLTCALDTECYII